MRILAPFDQLFHILQNFFYCDFRVQRQKTHQNSRPPKKSEAKIQLMSSPNTHSIRAIHIFSSEFFKSDFWKQISLCPRLPFGGVSGAVLFTRTDLKIEISHRAYI